MVTAQWLTTTYHASQDPDDNSSLHASVQVPVSLLYPQIRMTVWPSSVPSDALSSARKSRTLALSPNQVNLCADSGTFCNLLGLWLMVSCSCCVRMCDPLASELQNFAAGMCGRLICPALQRRCRCVTTVHCLVDGHDKHLLQKRTSAGAKLT
jgi:hypothetical protein